MSNDIGPIRRFYNRESGKSFVAAVDSSNDVITAELDENGNPVNAQNRIPREEYNEILKDKKMEADSNTAGFTMFGGKIIKQEKPDHVDEFRTR
jgi:hypothetical protein